MKMDAFCSEITESMKLDSVEPPRIFCAWEETWEKVQVGPVGDGLLEQRFLRKYGGLKWVDDKDNQRYTARRDFMFFQKKRGDNQYWIMGVREGYDVQMEPDDQKQLWECWERTDDFYEMITKYYEDEPSVKVFQKTDDCDSEDEIGKAEA